MNPSTSLSRQQSPLCSKKSPLFSVVSIALLTGDFLELFPVSLRLSKMTRWIIQVYMILNGISQYKPDRLYIYAVYIYIYQGVSILSASWHWTTGGPRHGGDATAPGAFCVNFMFFRASTYSPRLESCFGNSWWGHCDWNHRKSHLFLDLEVLTISFFARLFSACLKFIQPCCRLTPLKAVLPWAAVSNCVLMSMMSMSWSDSNGKSLCGGGGIFNDVLHIQPCKKCILYIYVIYIYTLHIKRNLLFVDHVFFSLWGWFQTTQTTNWWRCLHQTHQKVHTVLVSRCFSWLKCQGGQCAKATMVRHELNIFTRQTSDTMKSNCLNFIGWVFPFFDL